MQTLSNSTKVALYSKSIHVILSYLPRYQVNEFTLLCKKFHDVIIPEMKTTKLGSGLYEEDKEKTKFINIAREFVAELDMEKV